MNYIEQIESFTPLCEQEENDKITMLQWISSDSVQILTRNNKCAHITSSSMILNSGRDKVLMIYHNLYRSWAWTGGHADAESNLLRVAISEAAEETGVKSIQPLQSDIFSLEILPVWGHMKRGEYVSSHLHLNVTYLLVANESDALVIKEDENSGVAWLPIAKLNEYVTEPAMMPVYQKIIGRAAQKYVTTPATAPFATQQQSI